VLNAQKRLVGIVSLADLALHAGTGNAGTALSGIAQPGGLHTQSADQGAAAAR
jgi:hypothetical protein